MKKDQFKQKTPAESNTEREEHDIATKEASEIVLSKPALAYSDNNDTEKSVSLSNLPEKKNPNSKKNEKKVLS